MRVSILVTGRGERVIAPAAGHERQRMLVSDRVANGEAFDGEHVVRLPRRVCRRLVESGRLSWGFVTRALTS